MPKIADFDHRGAHRLIPTKFTTVSVLETLPLPAETLSDLSELDAATNERKVGERGGNSGISPLELVYQVPEAHIVNSAFTHPGPHGGRFNDARRGAWYAGVELDTSIHEVAFHKRRFLSDAHFKGRQTFDYADFLSDFAGRFHVLSGAERTNCLKPVSSSAMLCGIAGAGESSSGFRIYRYHLSERAPFGRNLHRMLPSGPGAQPQARQGLWHFDNCGER